jgi:hypothetical protein
MLTYADEENAEVEQHRSLEARHKTADRTTRRREKSCVLCWRQDTRHKSKAQDTRHKAEYTTQKIKTKDKRQETLTLASAAPVFNAEPSRQSLQQQAFNSKPSTASLQGRAFNGSLQRQAFNGKPSTARPQITTLGGLPERERERKRKRKRKKEREGEREDHFNTVYGTLLCDSNFVGLEDWVHPIGSPVFHEALMRALSS